jgi:hypothetical protein
MNTRKVYLISLVAVLLASFYPIYMGIVMLEAYFRQGGVDAADYPKYIIPYTPMCFAVIICVVILPLVYKLRKLAFPLLSLLGIGLFLVAELFFERMVVFNGIFVGRDTERWGDTVETWQWIMCRTPFPGEVDMFFDCPLIDRYSPVFKVHFYAIAILIVLVVIGVVYGFYKMVETGDYSKKKPLIAKLISVLMFIGLCIFACFTAFFRTGDMNLSPISATLQTVFFLVFGITGGVYVGAWLFGKSKLLSRIIPSVTAMCVTILMYVGELVMMADKTPYRRGTGFFFEPLGAFPLSAFDILVILSSGIIAYLILSAIKPKVIEQ